MKSFAHTILGTWILLFAVCIPFTYNFFPLIGIDLTNGLSSLSEWIAEHLFGVEARVSPTTSDSAAQFVQALLLLVFSVPMGLLLHKQKRFTKDQVRSFLHVGAAYILSLYLLKYGVDKLFQFQFYQPEPNTLFTPLGMLSKDILFWSSMGTSSSYNTFMGLSEVIPALLLLHQRTRLLGALIALGVLINVMAINIGFDITVKLLSSYLVIVAAFVLLPYVKSLRLFFFSESGNFQKPQLKINVPPKLRLIVKSVVILLLLTEVLLPYVQIGSFNGREMKKLAHVGSYEVRTPNSEMLGITKVKRIHIHSKGYLILEDEFGHFSDFPIRIGPDKSIFLRNEHMRIYIFKHGSSVNFEMINSRESKIVSCSQIDLNNLPARDDAFHWTVDGMLE